MCARTCDVTARARALDKRGAFRRGVKTVTHTRLPFPPVSEHFSHRAGFAMRLGARIEDDPRARVKIPCVGNSRGLIASLTNRNARPLTRNSKTRSLMGAVTSPETKLAVNSATEGQIETCRKPARDLEPALTEEFPIIRENCDSNLAMEEESLARRKYKARERVSPCALRAILPPATDRTLLVRSNTTNAT